MLTLQTGGRTVTLQNWTGNLFEIDNPDGGAHDFSYDGNHRVTAETFANLSNEWAYDSTYGTLATTTWGSGSSPRTTALSPSVLQGIGAPVAGTALASATDAGGHVTQWGLDDQGRPSLQIAADGGQTTTGYSNGFVTSTTDPLGRTTGYALDSNDFVTKTTFADGTSLTYQYQDQTISATGLTAHELTASTDELGNQTTYAYDSATGHQTGMSNALNQKTTYGYDSSSGLRTSVTDPLSHTTLFAFDGARRQTVVTDANGYPTTTTYDSNGNVSSVTDARGNATLTSYDVMGRLTLTTDALSNSTGATFNAAGLELTTTDALSRQTSLVYDTKGRGLLAQTIEAVGKPAQDVTSESFDVDGWATKATDPDGAPTRDDVRCHEPGGEQHGCAGRRERQAVRPGGGAASSRDAMGRLTTYAYDLRGRQTSTTDCAGAPRHHEFRCGRKRDGQHGSAEPDDDVQLRRAESADEHDRPAWQDVVHHVRRGGERELQDGRRPGGDHLRLRSGESGDGDDAVALGDGGADDDGLRPGGQRHHPDGRAGQDDDHAVRQAQPGDGGDRCAGTHDHVGVQHRGRHDQHGGCAGQDNDDGVRRPGSADGGDRPTGSQDHQRAGWRARR